MTPSSSFSFPFDFSTVGASASTALGRLGGRAPLRGARSDSEPLYDSFWSSLGDVAVVPAGRALSPLGSPKRTADPQRPHEGSESRALCLGLAVGPLLFFLLVFGFLVPCVYPAWAYALLPMATYWGWRTAGMNFHRFL